MNVRIKQLVTLMAITTISVPVYATWWGTRDDQSHTVKKNIVRDMSKPAPVINVGSTDGKTYNKITDPTPSLHFNTKYEGVCRAGRKVHQSKLKVKYTAKSFKPYNESGVQFAKDTEVADSKSVSGTTNLGGFMTNTIKQRAFEVCNTRVKNSKVPTTAKILNRTHDFTLLHKFDCNAGSGGETYSWTPAEVRYNCEGYDHEPTRKPTSKPKPPTKNPALPDGPGRFTDKFQVTKLVVDTNPKKYTGTCPANIKFGAQITTNGKGKVKYRWITSTSGPGPVQTLTFTKKGTKNTPQPTLVIKEKGSTGGPSGGLTSGGSKGGIGGLTQAPPGTQNHFVKLKILSPKGKIKTAEKHFVVKCTTKKPDGFATPTAPGKADITFTRMKLGKHRFHIKNKSKRWGGKLSVTAADATKVLGNSGKCEFPYKYSIVNRGSAKTEKSFKVELKKGNQKLDTVTNLVLNKGQAKYVQGSFQIGNGTHQLKALLDPNNKVAESRENNNTRSITLTVSGCGN